MTDLKSLKCQVCQSGAALLPDEKVNEFLKFVPEWKMVIQYDVVKLERKFEFKDFKQVLDFVNKVGGIADENQHHPLILMGYNQVIIWWWTHKINGLHQNDFIMAAKTDELIA